MPRSLRAALPTALGMVGLAVAFGLELLRDVGDRDAFSWMDPAQHFALARALASGGATAEAVDLPTLFPVAVAPFLSVSPSVAGALAVHLLSFALLASALHALVRELGLRTPSPVVVLVAVASPLWVGLTRTLYAEPFLTGVVAWALWCWLRVLRDPAPGRLAAFAGAVALGFAVKTTFVLFLGLPVAAAVFERFAGRRDREAIRLAAAFALPIAAVVGLCALLFPDAFGYYASLGNTAIPVMSRIGPLTGYSLESFLYYPRTLVASVLLGASAWLLLAALSGVPGALGRERAPGHVGLGLSTPAATLWIALLGPLLLLLLQTVKEPRHLLPCLVPAVLLGVRAIEDLPSPGLRRVVTAIAVALAVLQWGALSVRAIDAPYRMDGSLALAEIGDAAGQRQGGYAVSFALEGFEPDEALALTWWAFPSVVVDLDASRGERRSDLGAVEDRFEDPYLVFAFDTYNRRCGWPRVGAPLAETEVRAVADILLRRRDAGISPAPAPPGRRLIASVDRGRDLVDVYDRVGAAEPLRALVARRHLAAYPDLTPEERHVVAFELLRVARASADADAVRRLLAEVPALRRREPPPRNIYWIGAVGRDPLSPSR